MCGVSLEAHTLRIYAHGYQYPLMWVKITLSHKEQECCWCNIHLTKSMPSEQIAISVYQISTLRPKPSLENTKLDNRTKVAMEPPTLQKNHHEIFL